MANITEKRVVTEKPAPKSAVVSTKKEIAPTQPPPASLKKEFTSRLDQLSTEQRVVDENETAHKSGHHFSSNKFKINERKTQRITKRSDANGNTSKESVTFTKQNTSKIKHSKSWDASQYQVMLKTSNSKSEIVQEMVKRGDSGAKAHTSDALLSQLEKAKQNSPLFALKKKYRDENSDDFSSDEYQQYMFGDQKQHDFQQTATPPRYNIKPPGRQSTPSHSHLHTLINVDQD